jgi:predicted 2-oxoglutarate/Fe(II)-dependent dioxygenase YbiX
MKLEEAIVVLNNLTNKDFIELIKKYIDKKAINKLPTQGGDTEKTRNVFGHSLKKDSISDKIFFKHIDKIIQQHYSHYKFKFPYLKTSNLNQIDLLKYEVGGKYEIHTDHSHQGQRTLTFILNLNEDYEGGDFVFYNQDNTEMKRVKCKTATCIMFPSNFQYPHRIEPITKGTRYSIVAWLI